MMCDGGHTLAFIIPRVVCLRLPSLWKQYVCIITGAKYMCVARTVVLLLLCQIWLFLQASLTDAKPIDPSRLLVATVVDGTNTQIITDSHFFFRSIRLFGGSLNDAVLLACIVVEPDSSFVDDALLLQYSELGVEVDFIHQTPHPYPRTLNKFATFYKYDPNRFDHFLWLDADIIVFGDPLPMLPDLQEGKIWCVPEVYNYMKRFGMVNDSAIMWNSALPPFMLLQEDTPVSHGVCNTGMLLFDSISLRLFLHALFQPNQLQYFEGYTDDRFMDSLAFVIAVNAASIQVEPLDYIFNFMAFFELTLHSNGFRVPPLLVHFIHDTSLLFNVREDGTCYSMYQCTHINSLSDQENSMVAQQILRFFSVDPVGVQNCLIMANQRQPPIHAGMKSVPSLLQNQVQEDKDENKDEDKDEEVETKPYLKMLWPVSGSQLFVTQDRIDIDVIIQHSRDAIQNMNEVYLYFQTSFNNVITHDAPKEARDTCFEQNRCRSIFTFTTLFDISNEPSVVFHVIAVSHYFDTPSSNPLDSIVSTSWSNCSLIFQGFAREASTSGRMGGGLNQLMSGALPITLASQLSLSQFVNMRRAVDIGVVVCCDTMKGVETTKNLIRYWGEAAVLEDYIINFIPTGGILLISLINSPHGEDKEAIDALEMELSYLCKNAPGNFLGGCVITRHRQIRSVLSQHSLFYRKNYLSFVYLDSFLSHKSYEQSLGYWYSKLALGGTLIGNTIMLLCFCLVCVIFPLYVPPRSATCNTSQHELAC